MRALLTTTLLTLVLGSMACGARDPELYRSDTRKLLETKSGAIQDCYNMQLQTDRSLAGTIVVHFKVENDSGKIVNAEVDNTQSKGSTALGECVVHAIDGLVLTPSDSHDGNATFTWQFQAASS